MRTSIKHGIFICFCLVAVSSTNIQKSELDELEALLEFLEFDFEDQCILRSSILYDFSRGEISNLTQLVESEGKFARLLKQELEAKARYKDLEWDSRRLLGLMFTTGPVMLETDTFLEYNTFVAKTLEANVLPDKENNLTRAQIQKILKNEKNATILAETWSKWLTHVQNSSPDLSQQISLLQLEAEANGAETVESYWLSVSEVSKINYKGADSLWNSVIPLYNLLRQFIVNHIVKDYGSDVIKDSRNIPVHLLGSLDSGDWVTAAESLGALKESATYNSVKDSLKTKTFKDIYNAADENTADLQLDYLPDKFEKTSLFEEENTNCVHFTEEKCKSDANSRTLTCKNEDVSLKSFLMAHEEIAHIKHLAQIEKVPIGFIQRLGPRESVLYEAISTATALLSLQPESLKRRGLLTTLEQDANITSLLLTALHIIPSLPLHLSYDVWRLKAAKALDVEQETTAAPTATETVTEAEISSVADHTEVACEDEDCNVISSEVDAEEEEEGVAQNITEETPNSLRNETAHDITNETAQNKSTEPMAPYTQLNLTADWWAVREKLQGVGSPSNHTFQDFLLDPRVIWNKPHISKLLGPILLFQVLEHFKGGNTTENLDRLMELLRKGKQQPWEDLVEETFNITELSTEPLLNYFKPLTDFLEKGAQFKSSSNVTGHQFNLFMKGSSGDRNKKNVQNASEDSNALLIVIAGLAAIGSVAVVISVIRKKMQKKRLAKSRRRMQNTVL